MGTTAQFKSFGPYFLNAELQQTPRLYHFVAGTSSTVLNAYTDRLKQTPATNPIVGDANGLVSGYFDGLYKLVLKASDDATVLWQADQVDLTEGIHRLEGSLLWDPPSLVNGSTAFSPTIALPGVLLTDYLLVSAPYDLQGLLAMAYVSAADTVRIELQNNQPGILRLQGSLVWDPASLANGAGVNSPAMTLPGVLLGDYILVVAPYDLQGLVATAYVSASDTIMIRLHNATGGAIDLSSGTWTVLVLRPNSVAIDLAQGTWTVRALRQ
jgi:hypothetical protein